MKIAIIGGGLFGCNTASELSTMSSVIQIDIYEKEDTLFKRASSNNQHRFHTGFHYPRSPETIKQIDESSLSFKKSFSDCLFEIPNNYYFVSNQQDSKINFSAYKEVFSHKSHPIDIEFFEPYLHIEKLDGGLISNEMGINLTALKSKLFNKLKNNKINVLLNNAWKENNQQKYDFIINCSYYNPSLTTNNIKTKYELCELLLIKNPFDTLGEYSITIMDGNYSSLYATENKNIYTLSNVEKTPFFKTNYLNDLEHALANIDNFNLKMVDEQIIEKTREYYKLKNVEIMGRYICPKVKLLNDYNDLRTTEVLYEGKYVTLLQGKISTIQNVTNSIIQYLEKQ